MKMFPFILGVSFLCAGAAPGARPIVSEEELKAIAELVVIQKQFYKTGLINATGVLEAELLQLRAQYWAGKITREEFGTKAEAFHAKIMTLLQEQISHGINKTILLEAYKNLLDDRRLP